MDNFIYEDNNYGYALYDGGIIGKQGNEANTTDPSGTLHDDVCVSNNDFIDKAAWQAANHKMTYTDNSDPLKSPLVIRTGATYDRFNPDGIGYAYPNFPAQIYSANHGLITTTTFNDGGECERCQFHPVAKQIKHSIIELLEEIAAGTTTLPNDEATERLRVMQQQLYDLVKKQPELAQNSTDLQQFMYNSQWSSYDFFYYASYYAAKERMDIVQMLLGFWPNQSQQDENYKRYYQWLVNMYNGNKPSPQEVYEMAKLCPIKNGVVVYAARNLYNALTKEIHKFDNACEGVNNNARGVKKQVEMIRLNQPKVKIVSITLDNNLKIYPNPTKTNLNIICNNIKQIIVLDAMGKTVIQKEAYGVKDLQLGVHHLTKGLYLIKVIDSKGTVFTNKFIKE